MATSTRIQPKRGAKSASKPMRDVVLDLDDAEELNELQETQEQEATPSKQKPSTGDFFKDAARDLSAAETAAEDSDFGKRTTASKKRKRTSDGVAKTKPQPWKRSKRQPSPDVPDMSDMSSDDEREEDHRLFEKKKRAPPPPIVKASITSSILRLEVRSGPATININLADILPRHVFDRNIGGASPDLDGSTLLGDGNIEATRQVRQRTPEDFSAMRLNPNYACFLELEPALRNRIYREMLVDGSVVEFDPCPRSSRDPTLLQTCRQVYEEGRGILYGENAFHFDRTFRTRGHYYDREQREVGYKDVRRFLETIGSHNIAKLRFVSLRLQDAVPSFTPKLDSEERKFVNDAVLHRVLRLLGDSECVLDKFVVGFDGKGALDLNHVAFLRAFTSISCRKLIKTCRFGHSKIADHVWMRLKNFMKMPKLLNVDEDRQKVPVMQHELATRGYCHRSGWNYRNAGCSDEQ
ncbi:hypothetical protein LTS08_006255 [Lithohypha guttulata]|nr:hypothetical protein LTS08_006255 [Lithohypha guttulata]